MVDSSDLRRALRDSVRDEDIAAAWRAALRYGDNADENGNWYARTAVVYAFDAGYSAGVAAERERANAARGAAAAHEVAGDGGRGRDA